MSVLENDARPSSLADVSAVVHQFVTNMLPDVNRLT